MEISRASTAILMMIRHSLIVILFSAIIRSKQRHYIGRNRAVTSVVFTTFEFSQAALKIERKKGWKQERKILNHDKKCFSPIHWLFLSLTAYVGWLYMEPQLCVSERKKGEL